MPKVLIVSGGWDGHKPHEVAQVLNQRLTADGHEVTLADHQDAFLESANYDVVMPNWTMGEISGEQVTALCKAVEGGIGVAGLHGGMGDAFRVNSEYQFLTGGQFVSHPGNDGRKYTVNFCPGYALTAGLEDFEIASEKYYMHVDPAMKVLATTAFEDYSDTIMPIAWTKGWGAGRVFYCSLGHAPDIVEHPTMLELMSRGVAWAADRSSTLQGASFKEVYGA